MPFQKNKSGNPNGKPKGAVNKTTNEVKKVLTQFVAHNIVNIQNDFNILEPKDRLILLEKLLKYVIPQRIDNDIIIDVDRLSDEQVELITDKIVKKINL